jgi:HPt (histidine-containing phosphotransfer) domain-containing protein
MTANAMLSDKEACIQAGMNDHVGKPFELHNLINVLRLRAGWESAQAAPVSIPATDAPYVDAAIAAKVDIASALARLGGKQELYVRMLPMFLANLKELPQKLLVCLETQEYLPASHKLHSLKGLAGTMGAMDLAAQAGLAEKQLAGDITAAAARLQVLNINALISEMLPHLETLLSALQPPVIAPEIITEVAPEVTKRLDEPALLHSLESLLAQLRNSDMAATNTCVQIQEEFGAALGEQMEPLGVAMASLDFETAIECVLVLIEFIQSKRVKSND